MIQIEAVSRYAGYVPAVVCDKRPVPANFRSVIISQKGTLLLRVLSILSERLINRSFFF